MERLEELLAKVKEATGADRELDRQIDSALGLKYDFFIRPRFTSSVDAALALLERMLPGWGIEIGRPANRGGAGNARLYPGDERNAELTFFGSCCSTPLAILAILAALLSALIAQEAPNV